MYPVNLPGGHLSLSNKGRWERSSISAVVASFWFSQSSIGWSIDWINHSRIQESLIGKFWQAGGAIWLFHQQSPNDSFSEMSSMDSLF